MTDEDIITLGEFCEEVLNAPPFAALVQQFELQTFSHFTSTMPEEKAEREFIFATMRGMKDFVGHMVACVEQKNYAIKAIDDELSNTPDAHPEDFED